MKSVDVKNLKVKPEMESNPKITKNAIVETL